MKFAHIFSGATVINDNPKKLLNDTNFESKYVQRHFDSWFINIVLLFLGQVYFQMNMDLTRVLVVFGSQVLA